jgi:hypothetical protein
MEWSFSQKRRRAKTLIWIVMMVVAKLRKRPMKNLKRRKMKET